MIPTSDYSLFKAEFLAAKLKQCVIEGVSEEQANSVFAGYCESLLMVLAARYPEVRKELEDRIVYQEFNR
jgi:hypothetical protein